MSGRMQLYVLGPAFGLPSIDAECNAAIALLKSRLLGNVLSDGSTWELVPTHQDSTPLPYLLDGDQRVVGYKNIETYISRPEDTFNPEHEVTDKDRADLTAISSFLTSHAQSLLDISLYVSFENYSQTTRPAYSKVLPWHTNYILPPKRRSAARARTKHLGISSIDVDTVHEDMSNRPPGFDAGKDPRSQEFEAEAKSRASLLLPRKETVTSLLRRPEHAATFKLHALAEYFYGQLEDVLGEQQYLVDTPRPSATDCLAYGYLSLMLYPQVPQDWLAHTMRMKYKKLVRYTESLHRRLDLQTDVEKLQSILKYKTERDIAGRRRASDLNLPWSPPATSNALQVLAANTWALLSHTPFFIPPAYILPLRSTKPTFWQQYLRAFFASTILSLSGFSYYAFSIGLLVWPHGEAVQIFGRKQFADYGHLGAALSGISLPGAQARSRHTFHQQQEVGNQVKVEINAEGDKVA